MGRSLSGTGSGVGFFWRLGVGRPHQRIGADRGDERIGHVPALRAAKARAAYHFSFAPPPCQATRASIALRATRHYYLQSSPAVGTQLLGRSAFAAPRFAPLATAHRLSPSSAASPRGAFSPLDGNDLPSRPPLPHTLPVVVLWPSLLGVWARHLTRTGGLLLAPRWPKQQWFHTAARARRLRAAPVSVTPPCPTVLFQFPQPPGSAGRLTVQRPQQIYWGRA